MRFRLTRPHPVPTEAASAAGSSETVRSEPPPPPPRFAPPDPTNVAELVGIYAVWPFHERRVRTDRRDRPTAVGPGNLRGGRRRQGRRRGEERNIYVDRYRVRDLGLAAAVLVLNILDAYLTVLYLAYGGAEANPVAAWLLECGVGWFLGAKSFAVSLCLLFLVVHKNFRFVRPALRALLFFYAALLVYHLYLQTAAIVHGLA